MSIDLYCRPQLACRSFGVELIDVSDPKKRKSVGPPRIRQAIVDLILQFAKENPTSGYDRIQGAFANVGYHISDTTVGNILKAHGIEPAPDRQRQTT